MVIAALAVLKAGGAWVPLDPASPAERLALLFGDVQPRLVITEPQLVARLPGGVPFLVAEEEVAAPAVWPLRAPDDAAVVLLTSGSSGRPKAVVLEERSIGNLIDEVVERFAIGP